MRLQAKQVICCLRKSQLKSHHCIDSDFNMSPLVRSGIYLIDKCILEENEKCKFILVE